MEIATYDRQSATVSANAVEPAVTDRPAAMLFRHLCLVGFTMEQAGNITARSVGLDGVRSGWSLDEIRRLLFLRWLRESDQVD